MASIQEMIDKLQKVNFNDLLDESVMATKDAILNHNRMQLLFGKATDGSKLGTYAWDSYADFKAKYVASYQAPYGTYNFDLHGDFQSAMYVRALLTSYEISSTDSKTGYLESLAGGGNIKLGGERTFGLSEEDLRDYAQTNVKPELQKRLRTTLNI